MKFSHFVFSLSALMASAVSVAGTLSASSNLNFLAFDGQKVRKSTSLQVYENQQHQVVVEVSSIYRSGSDNAFFESKPIILSFNGSNEMVKITAPDLQTRYDVERFQKSPTFQIKTASGKSLEYKQDYLKGEGFMPNANIESNLAHYNNGENVAAVKKFANTMPAVMPNNNKVTKGKVMVQGENIAEQQLQYWFQQADKETQKRFLNWAKKQ